MAKDGGTSFIFVTEGIEAALEQAKAAAGDRDVGLSGGADVVQQYLRAGLVDTMHIHVAPLLLGGGTRLFDEPGGEPIPLEADASGPRPRRRAPHVHPGFLTADQIRQTLARARDREGTLMPATVIVGAQWGDEGKGKIVDLLAQHSDLVCRYQGGPNAGHTIVADGEKYKFRHMPSGILHGKECILGAGCVIDPEVFVRELDELEARGISTGCVRVSGNAHLIMPWHVAIDQGSERRLGKLQIGTTKRGIGPAYADKAARLGIRVQDLLDPKILRQKIEVALAEKNVWLERVYGAEPLELEDAGRAATRCFAQRLRPYVADTSLLVDRALRDGRFVLLEGAQGTLLDLDHGTYPFVTSSSTVARRRGGRRRDRAEPDRRDHRRREGVRHARRRGPVPDRDRGPRPGARARPRRRVRHGHRPRSAAAAGSTSSRCATRCG